jgi:proteic killer suppression protein
MLFADAGTDDIANGRATKKARQTLPTELHEAASIKIDRILSAEALDDLRTPPSNRLEALQGDRTGQYSLRINRQYRICFVWSAIDGASQLVIVDYH